MNYNLVNRFCLCGCGSTFRCLPTSPQRFMAAWHDKESMRFDKFMQDFVCGKRTNSNYRNRNREIYEARQRGLETIELVRGKAA